MTTPTTPKYEMCPGCGKPYPSECDWCSESVPRPRCTRYAESKPEGVLEMAASEAATFSETFARSPRRVAPVEASAGVSMQSDYVLIQRIENLKTWAGYLHKSERDETFNMIIARLRTTDAELLAAREEIARLKHDIGRHVTIASEQAETIAALEPNARRYQFLINLPKAQAQAFFWNWDSRKDRAKAIDAAISAATDEVKL
jgi:hypothetical protein